MINYDEYKGYSLLHWWYLEQDDNIKGVIVKTQIRGGYKILAMCSNIEEMYYVLGVAVLDSSIVECLEYPENLCWVIIIDLDKKGKRNEE